MKVSFQNASIHEHTHCQNDDVTTGYVPSENTTVHSRERVKRKIKS